MPVHTYTYTGVCTAQGVLRSGAPPAGHLGTVLQEPLRGTWSPRPARVQHPCSDGGAVCTLTPHTPRAGAGKGRPGSRALFTPMLLPHPAPRVASPDPQSLHSFFGSLGGSLLGTMAPGPFPVLQPPVSLPFGPHTKLPSKFLGLCPCFRASPNSRHLQDHVSEGNAPELVSGCGRSCSCTITYNPHVPLDRHLSPRAASGLSGPGSHRLCTLTYLPVRASRPCPRTGALVGKILAQSPRAAAHKEGRPRTAVLAAAPAGPLTAPAGLGARSLWSEAKPPVVLAR